VSEQPTLSVVVIGYNMARELPRTIHSLSPSMQRDIDADAYEIIVVDNGSTEPWDPAAIAALGPNVRVHEYVHPSPSPAAAINFGLREARGELIGVCIDGARIASPRLLATALEAWPVHPRPVIGTIAYHLGPDVQSRSIADGYDQAVEDQLLATSGWLEDGYRLFDHSTLAASSAMGWFTIPAETNALFLSRRQWAELGGYDERFRSAGGGLVNLDTWARACAHPTNQVVLLLGEATFHQVHGGIATNSTVPMWPTFHREYVAIRGHDYVRPTGQPLIFGRMTNRDILDPHHTEQQARR
jgi:glycosyltransferase involved in cell wall biosynthesis